MKASSQTFGSFNSRTLYLWAISCRLSITVPRPDFTLENFSANSVSLYRALARAASRASSVFRYFLILAFKAVHEHSRRPLRAASSSCSCWVVSLSSSLSLLFDLWRSWTLWLMSLAIHLVVHASSKRWGHSAILWISRMMLVQRIWESEFHVL
jgi:hypothetical protein